MGINNNIEVNGNNFSEKLTELEKILQKKENLVLARYIMILSDFRSLDIPEEKRTELYEYIDKAIKNSSDFDLLKSYIQKLYKINEEFNIEAEKIQAETSKNLQGESSTNVQSNDHSNIEKLIDKLKSDNNLIYYSSIFVEYREKLESTEITEDQKTEILKLLNEIYINRENQQKIWELLWQINDIIAWKTPENPKSDWWKTNAGIAWKPSVNKKPGKSASWLLGWESINVVSEIDFDWNYTVEEIRWKINELKNAFESWEIWKEFSEAEINIIIERLGETLENLEEQKEISLAKLEIVFDEMAKNIKEEWGKYYIELDVDGKNMRKEYNSREDALEDIRKLKSQSEFMLQSLLRSSIEWTLTWFANILWIILQPLRKTVFKAYELFWKEYLDILEYTKDSYAKVIRAGISEDIDVDFIDIFNLAFSSLLTLSIWSIFIWTHIWAFESLKRRVYDDFYKTRDQNNRNYVLEDYDRNRGPNWRVEMSGKDVEDYKEYQQRQNLMESIKSKLETMDPWSPEYKKFAKKIAKLEKYKLNKTSTFYYLAYKYVVYEKDPIWSFANSLKNTFHRWALYPIGLRRPWTKKIDSEWQIVRDSKWNAKKAFRVPLVFLPKIDDHQSLYSKTMDQLDKGNKKLLNWLHVFYPHANIWVNWEVTGENKDTKSEKYNQVLDYIKSKNYDMAKQTEMITKFETYISNLLFFPKTQERINTDLYIILNTDYLEEHKALNIIDNRISEIRNEFKLFSPKKLSSLRFFKLYGWELAKLNDLKKLIKTRQILLSESELNRLIKGFSNWKKFAKANYAEKIKNIKTEIDNFIDEMYETWKNINNIKLSIDKNLWDSLENFKKSDFWKWLYSHIEYILPNNQENIARNELEKFLGEFYDWKIVFSSEEDFYKWLSRIVLWNDSLNSFNKTGFENKMKSISSFKIYDFVSWQWIDLSKWANNELIRLYKGNIDRGKIYQFLNESQNSLNISEEIEKFSNTLENNKYTKWQASYILKEIISWSSFSQALGSLNNDNINHQIFWEIWILDENLNNKFNEIKNNPQKINEFLNFIKDKNIDVKSLPQKIQDYISIQEQMKEISAENLKEKINGINEKIWEIDNQIKNIKDYFENKVSPEAKKWFVTEVEIMQIIDDLKKPERWVDLASFKVFESNKWVYTDNYYQLKELAYKKINVLNQQKFNNLLELNHLDGYELNTEQKSFLLDYMKNNIFTRLIAQKNLWISKYDTKGLSSLIDADSLKQFESHSELIKYIESNILLKEDGFIQKLLPIEDLIVHKNAQKLSLEAKVKIHEEFSFGKLKAWDLFKRLKIQI